MTGGGRLSGPVRAWGVWGWQPVGLTHGYSCFPLPGKTQRCASHTLRRAEFISLRRKANFQPASEAPEQRDEQGQQYPVPQLSTLNPQPGFCTLAASQSRYRALPELTGSTRNSGVS